MATPFFSLWKPRLPLVPPCFKFHESRLCRAETAALNTWLQGHIFERREPPTPAIQLLLQQPRKGNPRSYPSLAHQVKRRREFSYRRFRPRAMLGWEP